MAEIAENEERMFDPFLQLSPDLRQKIIDEMQPDDRCRFTRCSKQTNKEAKSSKNYFYGLEFEYVFEHHVEFEVKHGKYESWDAIRHGYKLKFSSAEYSDSGKAVKTCTDLRFGTFWEIELDEVEDVVQYAIDQFKQMLCANQSNIKQLRISDISWGNRKIPAIDYGVASLDSLEELETYGNIDIPQLFSKLRKPLKTLIVGGDEHKAFIANSEQVYQVQDRIVLWQANLDNRQFLKLCAKDVTMRIGKLTERDFFDFIRSWQNGTIGKGIEVYRLSVKDTNFDKEKLKRLLRVNDLDLTDENVEIKHFKNAGKSAKLELGGTLMRFNAGLVEDMVIYAF